jgi:PAS domain S-box-containing protein
LVGVIGIPLRPDYLSKRLFDLHANPDDLLSVLREDGSFITRSRNLQEALNTQVAPSRPFLRARPGEKGLFRDVSTVDKIPLLFSWSRLKEWPLAVVVASNEAVGLGVLRQHQADERLRAILGTGALVIFSFTLAWLLWRLARVNAALAVSEGRFREQSERLQIAINGVNDGIWDWNLSTGELYLSPKWKEMLGYSDQELPNAHATFECLLHADDRPLVAKAVQRYLQGEIPVYAVECRLRHKDGSWRWILTRGEALRDADGKPYRMAGSHTDITDRKHLEGSLREHMRELTAILRSSSVGICHVKDRRVVWSNRRMGEIFGFTPDQMQGQSTRIFFVSQESFDALGRDAYPLLARGERYISEQEMGHQDGAQVWVRISGQAIAPEDQSAGSIWIFEDIAEQKATEQALIKAREAAEAANVAKTRFLAAMSHEIRTPMNGILGMAQLLVSQQVTENERREYARTILNSGQTLMTLLNDILDLSKVEAGKLTLHLVGFGPDQLLEEIAGLFRPTARQKDIAIKSTWLGTRLPRYRGDPHRLRQMLSSNAGLARKRAQLESRYDARFKVVFEAIRDLMAAEAKPKRRIGFAPWGGEGK